MAGLYYEQFDVGMKFEHIVRRTVTETDNLLFSALTMNPAALHLDAEYSKTTPFGERIVNSIFTLGLLVGLSVYDTTLGTTLGNLGWEEVKFPRPVLVGDTLRRSPLWWPSVKANPGMIPASSPWSTPASISGMKRSPRACEPRSC